MKYLLMIIIGFTLAMTFILEEPRKIIFDLFPNKNNAIEVKVNILNKRIKELDDMLITQREYMVKAANNSQVNNYESEEKYLRNITEFNRVLQTLYDVLENKTTKRQYEEVTEIINAVDALCPSLLKQNKNFSYSEFEYSTALIKERFKSLLNKDGLNTRYITGAFLKIKNTEKRNCIVFINGEIINSTKQFEITEPKVIKVKIKEEGFDTFYQTVEFTKEELYLNKTVEINYSPQRSCGMLTILKNEHKKIDVFLNEKKVPLSELQQIPIGHYQLRLEKENYDPIEQKVIIKANDEVVIYPQFKKNVMITSNVTAEIYIDNYFLGYTPMNVNLIEGIHEIKVAGKNQEEVLSQIVNTDSLQKSEIKMNYRSELHVKCNSRDYRLYFNGYQINPQQSYNGINIYSLIPGNYEITAKKNGCPSKTEYIVLRNNEKKEVNLKIVPELCEFNVVNQTVEG